jgi:hypothetical protein
MRGEEFASAVNPASDVPFKSSGKLDKIAIELK